MSTYIITTPTGDCEPCTGAESAVDQAARWVGLSPTTKSHAIDALLRGEDVELTGPRGSVYIEPAQ